MASFYSDSKSSQWASVRADDVKTGTLSPSVIPTVASITPLPQRTAGATYTSNEQAKLSEHDQMIRRLYGALVKLGAVR